MSLSRYAITLSRPASLVFWCSWHLLATAAIVVITAQFSVIRNGVVAVDTLGIGMAATYVMTAIVLTFYIPCQAQIRFARLMPIVLSPFSICFLFLLLTHSQHSRLILLISFAAALALSIFPLSLKDSLQWPALFILGLIILIPVIGLSRTRPSEAIVERKVITTSLYNLVATYHVNYMTAEVTGGAIKRFADRYLLATGDGQLRLLYWNQEQRQLQSSDLQLRVPLNRDDFVRDTKRHKDVNTRVFRTADVLVQDFGENFRLFASHHYWNTEKQCFTVRVSALRGSYSKIIANEEFPSWETVYESSPCLRFKTRLDPFAGYQIGGKLALLDNQNLLLTVGDHKLDGVDSDETISQDPSADYGKNILINLETHAVSTYSIGHRNAQGLYVDRNGTIWSTEHGPKGGDELNIIREGKNYGWPVVTYGTDYTQPSWPFNPQQGRHDGFELPAYAWIPAIGVSSLIGVRGEMFARWKGDLLVSSLADRSIYRVRIERERVTFTEKIEIGWRIRDLIEDANGRLILLTEFENNAPTETAIIVIEPGGIEGDPAMEGLTKVQRGKLLFSQCSGCHKLENGRVHGIGPDLHGTFDRPIGTAAGYGYSEALKRSSGRWTEENLDAFLTDPRSFAPGTSMQFDGIANPADRASLIEYLKNRKELSPARTRSDYPSLIK
jgi:cytochrome c2